MLFFMVVLPFFDLVWEEVGYPTAKRRALVLYLMCAVLARCMCYNYYCFPLFLAFFVGVVMGAKTYRIDKRLSV